VAEAITISSRQYAKRQETWFRHQLPADTIVLDATRPPDELAADIAARWRHHSDQKAAPSREDRHHAVPDLRWLRCLATELGLELARRGHEVHFISYASPFRLQGYVERVYFHEVETRIGRYPLFEFYPYTLALASKQHEVALREKLDVLHVHYAIPHATTAWLAREMLEAEGQRLRVITTLHGTDITLVGQEASFYAITRFSIERSDAVTAVSDYPARTRRIAPSAAWGATSR
jgi:hypothetical protein